MQKGNIGVTSHDIFPLIKKFMYNDQDIFIREIVSNAVDATQKLITLININEYQGSIENLKVNVIINKENKTITVSDNGIGMTEEEIDKYINQIAFSGANEFLEKYKDANIIGHFGLGFYSSFMVSDKVEIRTKSYKEGSQACLWSCEGTTEFEISDIDNESVAVGTDVIMYINDEYKEYLDFGKLKELLLKYASYLPVEINLVEQHAPETDASTGEVTTKEDTVEKITNDNALWTKQPSTLTDEDYLKFYKELYPTRPEPLFWIHINIDMPFTFTGILYFPAFDPNRPVFERKNLSLYCNRVYVTDNVEGILPDYLALLHGIIDSPDIPLNVSRSFLQNDSNVKKISNHIANKVFSSLKNLLNKDREKYEEKWDTIKMFINLGVITQEEVYDKAKDIILLTDIDNKKYTFDEYFDKVSETQKDKDGKIIYLYTYNKDAQYAYIESLKDYGYNILLFNDQYSAFEVQTYEARLSDKNVLFRRIDADTPDNLIVKEDAIKSKELAENVKNMVISLFNGTGRTIKDVNFEYSVKAEGKDKMPITIITDEWFRRMKEMSILNNNGFFLNQKATIKFVINSDAKVVKKIIKIAEKEIAEDIEAVNTKLSELNTDLEANKDNEDMKSAIQANIDEEIKKKEEIISKHAKEDNHINELIDIALLQYGLLNGEELNNFVKRSVKMIEK